jgi:dihydrofolate reductase
VITRDQGFTADGIVIVHDLQTALDKAGEIAKNDDHDEVFVIGGAQIYALAVARAERIYLTVIKARPSGDALFPALDMSEWSEVSREQHEPETSDSPAFSFVVYDRIS